MGLLLPSLLSKEITHYACIFLFVFFGVRLLYDVFTSEEHEHDELKEVEMEIAREEAVVGSETPSDTERVSPSRTKPKKSPSFMTRVHTKLSHWLSADDNRKTMIQAFLMTFVAEWGDRSQIATIALASSKDAVGVTFGGVIGHCICTGLAVLGGRLLASRISEKHVNLAGGCMFIFFAIASFIMGVDSD
jgi:putative Ca2+/H+ antiporter (TMEM165/GDT1 family)